MNLNRYRDNDSTSGIVWNRSENSGKYRKLDSGITCFLRKSVTYLFFFESFSFSFFLFFKEMFDLFLINTLFRIIIKILWRYKKKIFEKYEAPIKNTIKIYRCTHRMFLSFFHFQFIVSLPKINISRILRKRIDDFGQKYRQNSNRKRFVEKGFITRLNADSRYMENRRYKYIASNFPFSLPFLCPVTSGPSFFARKYIRRKGSTDWQEFSKPKKTFKILAAEISTDTR